MPAVLLIHVAAGGLALALGYAALFAKKGGPLHRRAGTFFVYAMLVMAAGGLLVAAIRGVAPAINIPIALLTAYLVVTSLTTVRPPKSRGHELLVGTMLVAFGISLTEFMFAFGAFSRAEPPFLYLVFGVIALLAGVGDLRILRTGMLPHGARRPSASTRCSPCRWSSCWAR